MAKLLRLCLAAILALLPVAAEADMGMPGSRPHVRLLSPPPGYDKTWFKVDTFPFYTPNDGHTDAAPALNRALAACAAAGGGSVILSASRYYIGSVDLAVPRGCQLQGPGYSTAEAYGADWTKVQGSLVLGPGRTIQNGGSLHNLVVMSTALKAAPSSLRNFLDEVSGFAGVGITAAANQSSVQNVVVVGFGTCIQESGFAAEYISNVLLDCNNGVNLIHSYDNNKLYQLEIFPFLVAGAASSNWQRANYIVRGISDNGYGACRLSLDSTVAVNGDTGWVTLKNTGKPGCNGRWPLSVVNATTVDLLGSSVGNPATACTTILGSTYLSNCISVASFFPGEALSGTGVAPGATVAWVDKIRNRVFMSAPATATGNTVTIVGTNPAFSAPAAGTACTTAGTGGTDACPYLWLSAFQRPGVGLNMSDSTGSNCWSCFVDSFHIGYQYGYLGVGGTETTIPTCVACAVDGDAVLDDLDSYGFVFNTGTIGAQVIGGAIGTVGDAIYSDAGQSYPDANKIIGTQIAPSLLNGPSGVLFIVASGTTSFDAAHTGGGLIGFIGDLATKTIFTGFLGSAATINYEYATTPSKVSMDQTTSLNSGYIQPYSAIEVVPSAANLPIDTASSSYAVAGYTNISTIANCLTGRVITLNFAGPLTVANGTGAGQMHLAGSTSLTTTADTSLTLLCTAGGYWSEVSRSVK